MKGSAGSAPSEGSGESFLVSFSFREFPAILSERWLLVVSLPSAPFVTWPPLLCVHLLCACVFSRLVVSHQSLDLGPVPIG